MSHTRTQVPTIYSALAADPLLVELVSEFVAEMPSRVARIRRQLESHDWDALRRTAHQLRGAAGSYGFEPITPLAQQVETLAQPNADPDQVVAAVQELVAHCLRITADAPR